MKINSLSTASSQLYNSKTKIEQKSFDEALKRAKASGNDEELKHACEELESVFLNIMLSQMRKTIPEGSLVEKSNAIQTFEKMLDEEYAKGWSKSGGIGLADILFEQLKTKIDE